MKRFIIRFFFNRIFFYFLKTNNLFFLLTSKLNIEYIHTQKKEKKRENYQIKKKDYS